jgi:hypothetical protein
LQSREAAGTIADVASAKISIDRFHAPPVTILIPSGR